MPLYDYECRNCGHRVEVLHGVNADGPHACADCGGPMRKLMSTPAIVFKGSGWAKKDRSASSTSSKKPDSAKTASDSGTTDSSSTTGSTSSSEAASTSKSSSSSESGSASSSSAAPSSAGGSAD